MPRYRKKPVEIEAVEVTAADFNGKDFDGCPFSEVPEWLETAMREGVVRGVNTREHDYAVLEISTKEGAMRAQPGDMILRGVQGELYPCKPDIFAATYERVD